MTSSSRLCASFINDLTAYAAATPACLPACLTRPCFFCRRGHSPAAGTVRSPSSPRASTCRSSRQSRWAREDCTGGLCAGRSRVAGWREWCAAASISSGAPVGLAAICHSCFCSCVRLKGGVPPVPWLSPWFDLVTISPAAKLCPPPSSSLSTTLSTNSQYHHLSWQNHLPPFRPIILDPPPRPADACKPGVDSASTLECCRRVARVHVQPALTSAKWACTHYFCSLQPLQASFLHKNGTVGLLPELFPLACSCSTAPTFGGGERGPSLQLTAPLWLQHIFSTHLEPSIKQACPPRRVQAASRSWPAHPASGRQLQPLSASSPCASPPPLRAQRPSDGKRCWQ